MPRENFPNRVPVASHTAHAVGAVYTAEVEAVVKTYQETPPLAPERMRGGGRHRL